MDISYIINALGEDREQYYNAIAPPIIQTSNFAVKSIDELRQLFQDEYSGYLYSRGLNPTVDILRKKCAALDGTEDCLIFNSGAAAIFSSVIPFVQSGDHIISVKNPYSWAQKCFDLFLPKFNVTTSYVEGNSVDQFIAAKQENSKLIFLESPNSWNYSIQDLQAIASYAKANQLITVIDNSYSSPLFQRPAEFGIDLILQSATKYIGGHSDTVAGILSGPKHLLKKIFDLEYLLAGNGIQPFNAWLLLRGLRTLPARMERLEKTCQQVIQAIEKHEAIEELIFPFHHSFPQLKLAKKQMSTACGLFSLVLKSSNAKQIETFCEKRKRFLIAVSWGGHESLIIPKVAGIDPNHFDPTNRDHKMVRIYIGLEDANVLIDDLIEGLDELKNQHQS
ncbi:MAG TPA: PLP-dependent transferase [Saprospiraceae bacterium]|nr:PLP-dependent transferase [Saprospiraceae bacterium]